MRIINDVEFSADDINEYKNIIYMNIIKGKLDSIILNFSWNITPKPQTTPSLL